MQKRLQSVRVLGPALLLGLLAVTGCGDQNAFVPPPPPTVTVAAPQQQRVTHYAQYSGTTEAVDAVEIRARVEGYLQSIHFADSSRVKKGDLLFVIDPRPYRARLDEAEADLAMRQAEMRLADATLKRKESAFEDNAVSEVAVIEARAERDQCQAAIAAAKAAIETARLDLSYTRIHAPISGRIGRHLVDVGNLVGAGEKTMLASIVSEDPIHVYFNVNERDLLEYRQHQAKQTPTNGNGKSRIFLGLSSEDGYPHQGHIDYVDNRVDEQTGTIEVRGVFANGDHSLLPGLFARLRTPISVQDNALVVPEQAFGIDQQGYYLLVVNDQNLVEYRPVQVGRAENGLREVSKGIAAGERVIVNGLQRVRPGAPVNPMTAEQLAAVKQPKAQ